MINTKRSSNKPLLHLQLIAKAAHIPERRYFQRWLSAVLTQQKIQTAELTIRIVTQSESTHLNRTYRGKMGPTNVLAFPNSAAHTLVLDNSLGDLAICAAVVAREARAQHKAVRAHWAHMVVHGVLHLLGFDHIKTKQAEKMEALEIKIMQSLGFPNPYE